MPELTDINWDDVEPVLDPLEIKVDTVYMFSRTKENLPANFPSGVSAESKRNSVIGCRDVKHCLVYHFLGVRVHVLHLCHHHVVYLGEHGWSHVFEVVILDNGRRDSS